MGLAGNHWSEPAIESAADEDGGDVDAPTTRETLSRLPPPLPPSSKQAPPTPSPLTPATTVQVAAVAHAETMTELKQKKREQELKQKAELLAQVCMALPPC